MASGGFVSGAAAKNVLIATGVNKSFLKKIWDLADVSKDGKLDKYEFVIAMFLASKVKEGCDLPQSLDPEMAPPK